MALFLVSGTDCRGEGFSGRFESDSEERLRLWFGNNRAIVSSLRRLPLSAGPFRRAPWLILVWPFLAWMLAMLLAFIIPGVVEILRGIAPWGSLAVPLALACVVTYLIYNILVRLGSAYFLDDDRIIQYAGKKRISLPGDEDDSSAESSEE